jgi:esterase/lipase/1-acyl-sn-glycerol-3-phosphate acyltransferase
MNRFAYFTTSLAIKALSNLSKINVGIHGKENIPDGSIIFVSNHFTRFETLLLPCHINQMTSAPAWSLADYSLFKGPLGTLLDKIGAVSTKNPDRDLLIVKSLLTGESTWIIFPEGLMVKNKKIIERGRYLISHAKGKRPPHTGAASLALRTEFYRERLRILAQNAPDEAKRLMGSFQLESIEPVLGRNTYIVPVNITYYPIRARENIVSNLLVKRMEDVSERMLEEIMAEGTMILSGVDVDIRFGEPIDVKDYLHKSSVRRDIAARHKIDFDDPIPSRPALVKVAGELMVKYMSGIYNLTTVNHDHLFASMVRAIPFKKIDEMDLRRRIFLLTTLNLDDMGIHQHRYLKMDQVHLLTDDRHQKFETFISMALEKGILKKENGTLRKQPGKFTSRFDFHQVRIENPLEVIANEIEPLAGLQRHIRRLARFPRFWLRRKIADHLKKRALSQFEEDYKEFYVEGESKKEEVGVPFLIKGRTRKIGVVLVHGYMAAPPEVRELADYLGRKGLWVYAPRLRGHGTSPDDLATRTYQDWVASIDEAYAIASNSCKRVVVGGFSTGAGLSLDVAARGLKNLAGIFAVSPPLRLQDFSTRFVPAVDTWNKWMKRVGLDGAKKEFIPNNPENPHINYSRNPIGGVRELGLLMEALEPKLPSIKLPVLVVQSAGDPLVDPKGSRKVFELLGSQDKQYLLFDIDRHGILLGDGADRVHRAIGNFIRRLV